MLKNGPFSVVHPNLCHEDQTVHENLALGLFLVIESIQCTNSKIENIQGKHAARQTDRQADIRNIYETADSLI